MIPFSLPHVPDDALDYISEALDSPMQQGDGKFSRMAEKAIESMYPGFRAFLTPSCTASLEISMILNEVGPGDEVIIPSFNFTSAATAVTKLSGIPVFCDIDPKTGCIDINMAESLISPRTKVITWVNYGGLGINVTELSELALEKGINLVEDAAHNFGVPTLGNDNASGDLAVFSFHATKNLQCGEGGAILVRKNQHIEKIYCIREKGTNRRDFNLGKASKYRWVSKGGSYLLSEINSALLMAQINEFNNIQSNRKETSLYYVQELQDLEGSSWSLLPGTDRASHLFALLAPSLSMRDRMIKALAEEGILAVSHYEDLASSPAGEKYGKKHQYSIRHSKVFSEQIIRLPLYYDIGSNRERVITAVKKSLQKVNQL